MYKLLSFLCFQSLLLAQFEDPSSLIFQIPNVWESRLYVFDINKDGENEYIVSVIHQDGVGKIYAFNREGIALPHFPFLMPQHSFPYINLYDSILIASYVSLANDNAYFLGINSDGQQVIPEVFAGEYMHFSRDPVIADITGDGKEEIIFLYAEGEPPQTSSRLIFYDPRELNIIAELTMPYAQVPPSIGDIDGDGINDVIYETGIIFDNQVTLWAFKGGGTLISGFPKIISGTTFFAGVHLADYLGDSRPEIILQISNFPNSVIKLLSPEGEELLTHSFYTYMWGGSPCTALGRYSENSYEPPTLNVIRGDRLFYIDLMNNINDFITLSLGGGGITTYRTIAADTSDSNLFTVVVQADVLFGNDSSAIFVINEAKQITQQISLNTTVVPQLFDVENDGHLDILYSFNNSFYKIPDFCEYDADKIEWPYEKHDPGRTSNYNYGDTVVPVELNSFTAIVEVNDILLNWATATETNNHGFEILRFAQNDNDGWNKIGFVPGHGTTTETHHYSYSDNDIKPGKYHYKLKQVDNDGSFEYSQILEVEIPFVNKFSLSQNYPNPFNSSTLIGYSIPEYSNVNIKVFDILGNEIGTLVSEEKPIGTYSVTWNAAGLPSGVYFCQLRAGSFIETKKMILMR